jgi:NitT/TauT family transport system permease protein
MLQVRSRRRDTGVTEPVSPDSPGRGRPPAAVAGRWLAVRLVPFLLFLAVWELGARALGAIDIPGVGETAVALVRELGDTALWQAFAESNKSLAIGYGGSLVVGVPLGLLIGRVARADAMVQGWLGVLLITPMAMIVPIIIMALGFSLPARSLIVFVFVLPMIVVNCRAGVRTVPSDLIDMTRTLGASEWQIWRYTILPAAAPAVFTGLRIGIGRAVTGMIIAERLLAAVGIGALLLQYRGGFQADALFAVVVLILLESLVLVQLVRFFERRLTAWAAP